jgi:hypothetical protein
LLPATGRPVRPKPNNDSLLLVLVFLDMNLDVFSIALRIVGIDFIQLSLCPKDFHGSNTATNAGNEEYYRRKHGKQIPQNIDQESKSNEKQSCDEKTGCEVSRRL